MYFQSLSIFDLLFIGLHTCEKSSLIFTFLNMNSYDNMNTYASLASSFEPLKSTSSVQDRRKRIKFSAIRLLDSDDDDEELQQSEEINLPSPSPLEESDIESDTSEEFNILPPPPLVKDVGDSDKNEGKCSSILL